MIDEKRKINNKENNPPPFIRSAPTIPPEKPLRKDLLKEQFLARIHSDSLNESNLSEHYTLESSSYIVGNTSSTDKEFSTINYLMANCDIDYESSMQISPTKMVGLMRPSTIIEESGVSYSNDDNDDMENENGAIGGENSEVIKCTNELSIHMAGEETKSSTYTERKYSEKITNISTNSNVLQERHYESKKFESKLLKTETECNQADDTLEEIEYVWGNGLNYVPKESRLKEEKSEATTTEAQAKNKMENDDEVILIDSSPETSFKTAKMVGNVKSAETTDYSFHTAKMDLTGKSKYECASNDYSKTTISTIPLDVTDDEKEESTETGTLCPSSPVKFPTIISKVDDSSHNTSDYSTDKNLSSETDLNGTAEMPDFNNTFERMEYMMERGRKLMERNKLGSNHLNSPSENIKQIKSPSLLKTPTGSVKKQNIKPTPSPRSGHKDIGVFKRPEIRRPSPSSLAIGVKHIEGHTNSSKIPKLKFASGSQLPAAPSSSSKAQFRHIASPIAAYIKNTPEVPLIKTIKATRNLAESNHFGKMSANHDITNQSAEDLSALAFKASLPRKACISAPQRQVIMRKIIPSTLMTFVYKQTLIFINKSLFYLIADYR